MRVLVFTVSYPPRRYIGSELMDHRLLKVLQAAGHEVQVHTRGPSGMWDYDDIFVTSGQRVPVMKDADVVICHADYGLPARDYRKLHGTPVVTMCHNTFNVVRMGISITSPDLLVVNSEQMRGKLRAPNAIVVNPPAPRPSLLRGDLVTVVSLNELKGGPQFWDIAYRMPDVKFLAVRSGYGMQFIPKRPPANVEVIDHVVADRMDHLVWSRTGTFLQLSSAESWGMAAAEATAHGIPVIAHPTPGLRENLGRSATWIDRDETAAWIDAIRTPRTSHKPLNRARLNYRTSQAQQMAWLDAIEGLESHAHHLSAVGDGR